MTSIAAFHGEQMHISGTAAADLSALQFTVVQVDSSGNIAASTAETAPSAGVLLNKPKSGDIAQVCSRGPAKVLAGGSVTAGAPVMATTGGKVINATATNYAIGVALFAGSSGDVITIDVNPSLAKYG